MINSTLSLFGTRLMVVLLLLGTAVQGQAAALFTLKGTTDAVKYADDAEIRLSVLGWSDQEVIQSVVEGLGNYRTNGDSEVLRKLLQEQPTKGYLFTSAATGHSIKYAWQDTSADYKRMVLLVIPALESINPYRWKQANTTAEPFSLLELRGDGQQFVLKTAAGESVDVSSGSPLQLPDFAGADTFATLQDDTPYYLKPGS